MLVAIFFSMQALSASKETAVEFLIPELDIPLYDQPGRGGKIIKTIPFAEFPPKVIHLETTVQAGRMHQIRLLPEGPAFWVKGTYLMLTDVESVQVIRCEADQVAVQGDVSRGVGGRTSCKKRDK
tara:strand:- start:31754 stop:32128 length:375 start_codon:yes stop_codon:yes gene_type:complete